LLTCDEDNVASIKLIEKAGGVLENKVTQEERDVPKRRYWIDTESPETKPQVRAARGEDAVRAQELRKLAWQNHYVHEETGVTREVLTNELASLPAKKADIQYFEKSLSANPDKNLVAVREGQVIGVVFYETLENGNGEIGVFVDEAFNNKGIGDTLLQDLIDRTSNDLQVTIFARNPSRDFYKRHGFIEAGPETTHEFRPGVTLPVQRLVLHRK
jgi:RimJ/RimL family protein N-acetyltransferase